MPVEDTMLEAIMASCSLKTRRRILVVDDDMHIQHLYREEFEEQGYEVHTAGSGETALEKAEIVNPDLVVLDILMPDIDGLQVLQRIKERRPHVPVIISTAYDYKEEFAVFSTQGYLIKSSDMTALKTLVNGLVTAPAS